MCLPEHIDWRYPVRVFALLFARKRRRVPKKRADVSPKTSARLQKSAAGFSQKRLRPKFIVKLLKRGYCICLVMVKL